MKNKMFSLKRQIVGASWLFIIIVALFLMTFLLSSINSYQKKTNEKRSSDVMAYADTLEANLTQLRSVTGEIYAQNNYFNVIDTYPSVAERWNCIYNLMNVMHIQVNGNKNIGGLFLYCDAFEQVQYAINKSMPFAAVELVKKAGKNILTSRSENYLTEIQQVNGESWLSVYMRKEASAIGGAINLSQGLPDEKEKNAAYGVIADGKFYCTETDETESIQTGTTLNSALEQAAGLDLESTGEKIPGLDLGTEATPAAENVAETLTENKTTGEEKNTEILDSLQISKLQPGTNHIDGKVIYVHQLNSADLAVAEVLPESIWLYINGFHIVYMLLIILFVIAAVRIEKFVYYELSRPLEDMTNALQSIKTGVWEVDFSAPNRISEIEDVRQSVKTLLAEIEQYKIKFYEEELEKAKIHRQYLQLQLTPHFYTNCLKNAYYMLMLKEYDNAEIFLQRLSVHLRYLLQQEKGFVTIREELDFVQNYVDLQKLMTSKPLTCEITADEAVMEKEVPILTLQTFIENSTKYARDMTGKELRIHLIVKYRKTEEGNYLDITVKDNGPGYPEELLKVINEFKPEEKEGLGIGVINLQSRLRIFYGDQASWYFENHDGAVSELVLPEKIEVQE